MTEPSRDYNAADDMRKSIEFAYAFIRARVARGGQGWCGWPAQSQAAVLDKTEAVPMASSMGARQ